MLNRPRLMGRIKDKKSEMLVSYSDPFLCELKKLIFNVHAHNQHKQGGDRNIHEWNMENASFFHDWHWGREGSENRMGASSSYGNTCLSNH